MDNSQILSNQILQTGQFQTVTIWEISFLQIIVYNSPTKDCMFHEKKCISHHIFSFEIRCQIYIQLKCVIQHGLAHFEFIVPQLILSLCHSGFVFFLFSDQLNNRVDLKLDLSALHQKTIKSPKNYRMVETTLKTTSRKICSTLQCFHGQRLNRRFTVS